MLPPLLQILLGTFTSSLEGCRRFNRYVTACLLVISAASANAEFNVDWVKKITAPTEHRSSAFLGAAMLPNGSIATVGNYTGNWITETYAAIVNSDGTTKWQVVLDDPLVPRYGADMLANVPVSIISDPAGNPVIAYACQRFSPNTCLAKFRATDGAVVWRREPLSAVEGQCSIAIANPDGFYRYCPTGSVQKRYWDGSVAWTDSAAGYSKLQLPLASGNFVKGNYGYSGGTITILSGQSGQILHQIPVPGEIYGAHALSDGGLLLQTLRNTGTLPFRSTLDRYDGTGTLLWRHERADSALNFLSYSGQELMLVGDTVIRYTPSSLGELRIATGLDGTFRWQSSSASNSQLLNLNDQLFVQSSDGLRELLLPINHSDGTSAGPALQIAGYTFSNTPIANGLLVARQGSDTADGYVLERYSTQIIKQWQSDLFTVAPQIAVRVPTNSSIFDPEYSTFLPRGCKQLRSANAEQWIARLVQKSPIFGASSDLNLRFASTTGAEISRFNPGSCDATVVNSSGVYSLTSTGELQKATDVGTTIWTVNPFSAYAVRGNALGALRGGFVAVAASSSSESLQLAWTYGSDGVRLSGPTTLPDRAERLVPSLGASYFAFHANKQVSFVDDTGTLVWTLPAIVNTSCNASVREVFGAANGDLMVISIDCYGQAQITRISTVGVTLWQSPMGQYLLNMTPVAAIEMADGAFVVAGCSGAGRTLRDTYTSIQTFNADGTLRWARNDDVFTDSTECAEKLNVTPDGKIWLAVSSSSTCSRSVLMRLGADGALEYADSRPLSAPLVRVSELAVLPDATLLALGDGYDELDRTRVASLRKISPGRSECVLDVNGDGAVDVQSDALPLLRFMFGFNSLRSGFLQTRAVCSFGDTVQIARAKSAVGTAPFRTQPSIGADIDGDGTANPLVDGLLLIRALLGLRGSALTNAISFPASATRTTATDIMTYLSSCAVSAPQ